MTKRLLHALCACIAFCLFGGVPLSAQVAGDTVQGTPPAAAGLELRDLQGDGWNRPEALELAARGRAARTDLIRDGDLESYQALTEGHIYFFVDPEEGERSLIRVDQIAVELFWQAPDHTRQRLVGERSETRLPVRDFRYYLDRLTLVQYGFGDEIEVGQGMDVSGVPHPLAPLAGGDPDASPYDFRLADSISLRLPGEPEPLRIYELQVRPKDSSAPGILGSIFLDREDAQLVRMSFTFTPASYVDRRTDRIAVELDYGLWEGRYWLPNTQRVEVRRELPELDLGVGTVIRAVLRVGDYELNVPLPDDIRFAPAVTALPDAERAAYEFPEGLFSALERDGLADVATRADPRELRVEAARMLRDRPPTGLSPVRLHLPDISSFASYDRTRGPDLGGGVSIRPKGVLRLRMAGGWSFGPDRPRASLHLDGLTSQAWAFEAEAGWNGRDDLGVAPGMAPLFASFGGLALGEDYIDPYRASGGTLRAARILDRGSELRFEAGLESHRSEVLQRDASPWNSGRTFRPVLPIVEGTFGRGEMRWIEFLDALPGAGSGRLAGRLLMLGGEDRIGGRAEVDVEGYWRTLSGDRDLTWTGHAGALVGDPLAQLHRLGGGRGTVPGHPYRSLTARSVALSSVVGAVDLGSPALRMRAGLHGGWFDGHRPPEWEDTLGPAIDGRAVGGVTLGLGLIYDLVRVEGARGFGTGGEWQVLFSVDPRWWGIL